MISINAKGLTQSIKAFRTVKKRFDKRKEANAKAVLVIDKWIQKNFQSQGKDVGGWAKLKPATLKQRKGSRILVRTGQLRTRWAHKYDNEHALVESGISYGIYHDQGTRNLPRRQIAPDAEHVGSSLEKIFNNFTEKVIKEDFHD